MDLILSTIRINSSLLLISKEVARVAIPCLLTLVFIERISISFSVNALDISKALTEKDIDILSMNTRVNKQGIATLATSFEISNRDELIRIVDKIRSIESVVDVERTTG